MPPKASRQPGVGRSNNMLRRRQNVRNILQISDGDIRRLARRGGVKRISHMVFPQAKEVMFNFLRTILKDALVYTQYANRKVVRVPDLVYAANRWGRTVYGFN